MKIELNRPHKFIATISVTEDLPNFAETRAHRAWPP